MRGPLLAFAVFSCFQLGAVHIAGRAQTNWCFAIVPQVEPEAADFVYYLDPQYKSFIALEPQTEESTATSNVLSGKIKGQMVVHGQASSVRLILSQRPEFVIRPADPSQHFGIRFERFEIKNGARVLKFVKDPKPSNSPDRPGLLAFDSGQFGKSSLRLSIPYDLPAGEYGITVSAGRRGVKVFCFGVDSVRSP